MRVITYTAHLNDDPWPVATFDRTDYPTVTDWMLRIVWEQLGQSSIMSRNDGSWTDGRTTLRFKCIYRGPDGEPTTAFLRVDGSFVQ